MAKVIWTEPALEDLIEIINFISRDSIAYAERFADRVVTAPRKLEAFPSIGRIVPEFNDKTIRELIHGSYRIIYTVAEDACYIVAVIHGSRDMLRHIKPGEWDIP